MIFRCSPFSIFRLNQQLFTVEAFQEIGCLTNKPRIVSKAIDAPSKHFKPESRSSEESALCTPAAGQIFEINYSKISERHKMKMMPSRLSTIRALLWTLGGGGNTHF
jgi:hypothetical protein